MLARMYILIASLAKQSAADVKRAVMEVQSDKEN